MTPGGIKMFQGFALLASPQEANTKEKDKCSYFQNNNLVNKCNSFKMNSFVAFPVVPHKSDR